MISIRGSGPNVVSSEPAGLHFELRRYHDDSRRVEMMIDQVVDGLSSEQVNQRPELSSWSIAECIVHLCTTARVTELRFEAAIERGRKHNMLSGGPFKYGRLTVWFVNSATEYPPRRRFKAPKTFQPSPEIRESQSLATEFRGWQERQIALLHQANGLNLRKVKVISPVSRFLRISLGPYFLMMAGHQFRHLYQAEAIKQRVLLQTTLK